MAFRVRIKKSIPKNVWGWIVLGVVVLGIGIYAYLARIGKVPSASLIKRQVSQIQTSQTATSSQIQKKMEKLSVTTEKSKEGEKIVPEPEQTNLPVDNGSAYYEETAQKGEGITHLARKALKKYLSENEIAFKLTPQHKVYIEDYIQNHIGNRWLKLGEKLDISKNLIEQAIGAAENLTPRQLEDLTQYSSLVPSLNY